MQSIQTGQIEASNYKEAMAYGSTLKLHDASPLTSDPISPVFKDTFGVISLSHDDLLTTMNNGKLLVGQWYKIFDYATNYTQVETGVTKTGSTESLLVYANSNLQISKRAFSADNPEDFILYEIDPAPGFRNYDPVGGKGIIYYREDGKGNSAWFDFRETLFPRWETTSGGGDFVSYVDTGFAMQEFALFNDTSVYDNKIGNSNLVSTFLAVNEDLPNIVFKGIAIGNRIGDISYGMTFDTFCTSNRFEELNIGVVAGVSFASNKFTLQVQNMVVGNNFYSNLVEGDILNFTAGDNVANNKFQELTNVTIGSSSSDNIVGDMSLSTLGDNFDDNYMPGGVFNVQFVGSISSNVMMTGMSITTGTNPAVSINNNIMSNGISTCGIEGNLSQNHFNGGMTQCTINAGGSIVSSNIQGTLSLSSNIDGQVLGMKCKSILNFNPQAGSLLQDVEFSVNQQNISFVGNIDSTKYTAFNTVFKVYNSDATLANGNINKTVVDIAGTQEYYYVSATGPTFTSVVHP